MPIYPNFYQTLSACPIVELRGYAAACGLKGRLYAYLDFAGPTGTARDGLAEGMLALAIEKKKLSSGQPIIEAASGPFAAALTLAGLTGPHGISDLGYGFVPENFNAYVVDNVVAVNTTDAQRAAQKVLRTDAIPASVASGAVLQAAAQLIHVGASRSALAILPGRQIVNTL